MAPSWESLPEEIMLKVTHSLATSDVASMTAVCSVWRKTTSAYEFWLARLAREWNSRLYPGQDPFEISKSFAAVYRKYPDVYFQVQHPLERIRSFFETNWQLSLPTHSDKSLPVVPATHASAPADLQVFWILSQELCLFDKIACGALGRLQAYDLISEVDFTPMQNAIETAPFPGCFSLGSFVGDSRRKGCYCFVAPSGAVLAMSRVSAPCLLADTVSTFLDMQAKRLASGEYCVCERTSHGGENLRYLSRVGFPPIEQVTGRLSIASAVTGHIRVDIASECLKEFCLLPPHKLQEYIVHSDMSFLFLYKVRISMEKSAPKSASATLAFRHWDISYYSFDDTDGVDPVVVDQDPVHEAGVLGMFPKISPGTSFEYTSICRSATPIAQQSGYFSFVVDSTHEQFDAVVPNITHSFAEQHVLYSPETLAPYDAFADDATQNLRHICDPNGRLRLPR